jgi:ABC-type transport system substrate-binding protein
MSLLLLLMGGLATGGCRSGGGGAGGGGGQNVLRYALQTRPTSLDPATVEDGDTIDLLLQVFEGLVQWNEQNQVVPNLAEKWEISPDGRVYTFTLKDNVYFHPPHKRKVTAQDFEYSITRALLPATRSGVALSYLNDIVGAQEVADGKATTLAGLKALDERRLQITIDKRKPYFLGKLTYPTAYVVCREAVEQNQGRVDEKSMIGTGPFMLKEYRVGYNVSLVANAEYHGGKPLLDGIERPILTDSNARQTAYESGQLDITDVQLADLDRIRQDSTLSKEIKQFTRAATWYLSLNQKAFEPFRNRDVRRAFAHAINKDALIRTALKDTVKKANGVLPPGVFGYDPTLQGIPYDPEKAKELLAKAGYPGGRNFPKLVISFRQGYKQIEDGAISIRNDLKQNLGIEADLQPIEWTQFLKMRADGVLPCSHLRWGADYLDAQNFLSLLLHSKAQENTIGYSNPEFDRLCDLADVEVDPKRRESLYRQAERIVVEDAPWVCLYFQSNVELHKPYVQGIRDGLLGHLPHTTVTVKR